MKKKVLVYPCGTEIGLEIHNAIEYSTRFELWGGSSNYDHGRYVYKQHIDNLPFISDSSTIDSVCDFFEIVKSYDIDFIYPAMDGVLYKLSQFADRFNGTIIAPEFGTTRITRSKALTYDLLKDIMVIPMIYNDISEIKKYPVFVKPDVGQGSNGAQKIENEIALKNLDLDGMLLMEYLPGEEYSIDCFTNNSGDLIYIFPRSRKRIKNGISVSSVQTKGEEFTELAILINSRLKQRGGWFFQVKRNQEGKLVLLEVASRIAGTSALVRSKGINLPLLTIYLYDNEAINHVSEGAYDVVIDRALYNSYATDLYYDTVYIDYDDTIIFEGKINYKIVAFLYQCINRDVNIILLTKHNGNLNDDLQKYRLSNLFDEIIHIEKNKDKSQYISEKNAIFIDDSFGERELVKKNCQIPVFDTNMIDFLSNSININRI